MAEKSIAVADGQGELTSGEQSTCLLSSPNLRSVRGTGVVVT